MKTIHANSCRDHCPYCGVIPDKIYGVTGTTIAIYYCQSCDRYFLLHIDCPQNVVIGQEEALGWLRQKRSDGWPDIPGQYTDIALFRLRSVIVDIVPLSGNTNRHDPASFLQASTHCSGCLRLFPQ